METPDFSHLPLEYFDEVYEPSEDTFLLMDAIENDLNLIKSLRPTMCVEVGSGSGVVITAVAKALGNTAFYISTDINCFAAKATKKTAHKNGVCLETTVMDLTSGFEPRLHHQVDLLIFNPPYVVTPSSEVFGSSLQAAWAGGKMGREVMDRFFPHVKKLLSNNGLFYLVIVAENDKNNIAEILSKDNLQTVEVMSRKCGREHLSVLRINSIHFSKRL